MVQVHSVSKEAFKQEQQTHFANVAPTTVRLTISTNRGLSTTTAFSISQEQDPLSPEIKLSIRRKMEHSLLHLLLYELATYGDLISRGGVAYEDRL